MKLLPMLLVIAVCISCKNPSKENTSTELIPNIINTHTWKIHGTEPFWGIYIHNDTFLFTKLNEKIDSVYFIQQNYKEDSLLIVELADNVSGKAVLTLKKENCSDGMSDNTYEYSAAFSYDEMHLSGCGTKY